MKYLVNSREMKQYDTNTTEHFKVPSLLLMERAALAVFDEIKRQYPCSKKFLIVCGTGNPAVTFGRSRGAYGVDR